MGMVRDTNSPFAGMNWVQVVIGLMAALTVLLSVVVNACEKHLPAALSRFFRYGKFAYTKTAVKVAEVPKAWFKHFYVFSSIFSTLSLILVVLAYVYNIEPPKFVKDMLDFSMGSTRQATVTPSRVLLAMALLAIQCIRRCYDTHFISVFSTTAKMNISHYIIGYLHYAACFLAILGEAPKFISSGSFTDVQLKLTDVNEVDGCAAFLFLWSWYHQYKVTVILANLRKNKEGEIVSQGYKLPQGDWFDYVSSPHSLSEILMYISLTFILWRNITWWFVLIWVISNQVETSLLSHWWYQEKFKDIPKQRKAVFPCIL